MTLVTFYVLLMYFWSAAYLHAVSVFITSYAAGVWYYSPVREDGLKMLPDGNTFCDCKLLLRGFCASLKHLGSLAMGSLIMAVCTLLVLLCRWAKHRHGATNPVAKAIFAVSTCVALCLERCARLVTSHAYIQMALVGKCFCVSCTAGLGMIVRHPVMAAIVGRCGLVLRLVGPLAVMGITGLGAWACLAWVKNIPTFMISSPLQHPQAPMAAILLMSFVVGDLMMHPYSVVCKTVMHAFCADKEMNEHGGGGGFLPHTPEPLRRFVLENTCE
jgi:hypothetical protein